LPGIRLAPVFKENQVSLTVSLHYPMSNPMAEDFEKNGFVVVNDLIDPASYYQYIKQIEKMGLGASDEQVKGATIFYKAFLFEKLLEHLLPVVETNCGHKLYKTYSYARIYHMGEELKVHTDREACEITVSIALGYEGAIWPFCLFDKDNKAQSLLLQPGAGIIFRGKDLPHWRELNTYGNSGQVFLHYVDQEGMYAQYKDDCKPQAY